MARIRWLVCVCAFLWPAAAWSASQLPTSIPRVRPLGSSAAVALERGIAHSATFRELVARLGRSDVVVYVEVGPRPSGSCPGAIRFLTSSPYFRFLHVSLDRGQAPKALVALLAHELRHAIEVADTPEIRDVKSFSTYYERHGLESPRANTFDSRAAQEAGQRVREELAEAPLVPGFEP